MVDLFLYGIFPYVAIAVALTGLIWRYATNQFSYSSVSSQFLENRQLFWGSVPWHWGIILILLGHLVGVLFPRGIMLFNGVPARLYILEGTALALGLLALAGLIVLLARRGFTPRVRAVTTPMDVVLLVLFLVQIAAGIGIALFYRWGSSWYVHTAVPYLWSVVKFSPKTGYVASLPFLAQLHIVNALLLLALTPFTRLVHMLSIPWNYLWRPYQVVIWYRRRSRNAAEADRKGV